MEAGTVDKRVFSLMEKLRECEARFAVEARRRGFDPAQAENMAMPATLARVFTECADLRSQLQAMAENKEGE